MTPKKHAVEIVPVTKSSAQHPVKDTITIKPTHKLELKITIPEEVKPAKVKVEDKPITHSPATKTKANMFEDIRDIKPPEIKLFSSGKLEKVNKSKATTNTKESAIKEVTNDSKIDTKVVSKVDDPKDTVNQKSSVNDAKISNNKSNDAKNSVQPKSDTKPKETVSKKATETKNVVKKADDNLKSPIKVETSEKEVNSVEKLKKNDTVSEKATKKDQVKTNSNSEDVKNKYLVKEDNKDINSDVNELKKKAATGATNTGVAVATDNKIDPVIDKGIF